VSRYGGADAAGENGGGGLDGGEFAAGDQELLFLLFPAGQGSDHKDQEEIESNDQIIGEDEHGGLVLPVKPINI
jgi:hypothetical protein